MNCNCPNYSDIVHEYEKCIGKTNQLEKYAAPMMWIGLYVALASLLCFLATAVDLFWCIHQRKFWFPCKYFTLNAIYVTVIAVLTKILLDLNNPMPSDTDQLVKLSSTICLSTIMCNVMPSLGTMDEHEILVNLTALGILVITIVVNIFIQLDTGVIYRFLRVEFSLVAYLMFLLFVVMCFSALAVPSSKQYVEGKYGEIHEMASKNEKLEGSTRSFTTEKLAVYVTRYWIMAETGNPQFVMARFATCSTVGLICFLNALILVKAELQLSLRVGASWFKQKGESDYKSTTLVILVLQTLGILGLQMLGVLAGTIAPLFRWFISVSLKWSVDGGKFHRSSDFSIEKYWVQQLMELKQNPMALRIEGRKRRRIVHVTKTLALNLCIRVQIVIVLFSKMVRLVSIFIASPVLSSCYCCAQSKKSCSLSEHNTEVDISRYVVRLEDERKLPKRILKNISNVVNRVIRKAKKHQPANLMQLIERSNGFNGVVNFDSDQVEHLHSQEPPNCWSLVVVTLTSIAITLPNIAQDATNRLLSSVKEGLSYIRLIEKSLDTKGDLVNAKKAADYVWLGVELYCLWLNNDLQKIKETRTYKATLEILVDIARATVLEFKRNANGGSDEDPLNWPLSIVTSNSMYRISQTILTSWHQPEQTNSGILFHQVSVVIADILGACLTNLPRVITMYCYCSTIEKREENVRLAANLLGETEEILKVIQRHETPAVSPDQVVYIDEWRACLKEQSSQFFSCSSESNEIFYPANSGEFRISIESV